MSDHLPPLTSQSPLAPAHVPSGSPSLQENEPGSDPSELSQLAAWTRQLWAATSADELLRCLLAILQRDFACQTLAAFRVQRKGNRLTLSKGPALSLERGAKAQAFPPGFTEQLRLDLVALTEHVDLGEGLHQLSCQGLPITFLLLGDLKVGGHLCVWQGLAGSKGAASEHQRLALLARLAQQEARWYRKLDSTQALLYVDELTGLYNYRYLDIALDSELRRANRYRQAFSLLFIDLDNFKEVNDSFGHLAGSAVLRQIGGLLKEELREVDTIIRYGGDEYVVILLGAPTSTGVLVGERIRARVAGSPLLADGHQVRLTTSIGVASYPDHGRDKETLLRIADETMYLSKREGKNRVMIVNALAPASDRRKRVMTISG